MQSNPMPTDLQALLHTLWRHQALSRSHPSTFRSGDAPLPAPVTSRDAVHELVRWALAQADNPGLAIEALEVAAWLLDDPAVLAATRPWLESSNRRARLAACMTLYLWDAEVQTILDEETHGGRREDLMGLVQPICLTRADPGAVAALAHVAGASQDDNDTESAIRHLARWAPDDALDLVFRIDAEEAMAFALPLRDRPGTLERCLGELGMSEELRSQRVLEGLACRADPACIEGVFAHWDEVCLNSSDAATCADSVPYPAAMALLDGLAADPAGEAELQRLSTHTDPAVAILARSFRLRAAPTQEALDALNAQRAAHENPEHEVFGPLHDFLEDGGLAGWTPTTPLTPAARLPMAPRPAFLGLPPRPADAPPLVEPPAPPPTGWTWSDAPAWTVDAPRSWEELPVVAHLGPLPVYYAAPLIDTGHAELLGDMEQQLTYDPDWGVPEWPEEDFLDAGDEVTRVWVRALRTAATTLASRHHGRDDEWLGFLCHSLSKPVRAIRARVESLEPRAS